MNSRQSTKRSSSSSSYIQVLGLAIIVSIACQFTPISEANSIIRPQSPSSPSIQLNRPSETISTTSTTTNQHQSTISKAILDLRGGASKRRKSGRTGACNQSSPPNFGQTNL